MSDEPAETPAPAADTKPTREGCLMRLLVPRKGKRHWALLRLAVAIALVVVFRLHVLAWFAAGHNFLWQTFTGSTENHPRDIGLLLSLRGPGAGMLVRLGEEAALADAPAGMIDALADYATSHARPEVRARALEGLGNYDDPRARAAAAAARADAAPAGRRTAAQAIRENGSEAELPALKKALAMEQDSEVQGALRLAILTLSKLTPSPEEPKPPAPRGR